MSVCIFTYINSERVFKLIFFTKKKEIVGFKPIKKEHFIVAKKNQIDIL